MSKNVQKPMVLLFLGICPMVAVTGTVLGALGMAAAMLAVMLLSNVTLWALRKVIPQSVRVPAILLVTAFYVTAAQMTMNALLPTIYQALGIYLAVTAVLERSAETERNRQAYRNSTAGNRRPA